MARPPDTILISIHAALDAQRQARGITWDQAVREISHGSERPISRSTVTGLATKAVAEGDGILQMLRWLSRSPESFVGASSGAKLPETPPHQILRFDTRKLYSALDDKRLAAGLTWKQVAEEIGEVSPASLTHLLEGSRVAFPGVMRMTEWLGQPVASFTSAANS